MIDLKKNDLILTTRDEEFVSLFELFNEATVLTQGESYGTIGLVAPPVLGILNDLQHEFSSSTLILVSLCKTLISSIKSRFSGLLRHFEIDVPFYSHSTSERFADAIFLVSPLFDARFKLVWLDNLHIDVKAHVLKKIPGAIVPFHTKITFQLSTNMPAGVSNEADRIIMNTATKGDDSFGKRKCLFPYLDDNNKKIHLIKIQKFCSNSMDFYVKKVAKKIYFSQRNTYIQAYIILDWSICLCQLQQHQLKESFPNLVLLCVHIEHH